MKKFSLLLSIVSVFTVASCNQDRGENKGKEAMEEMEHEADEAGDNIEDAAEEVND